MNHLLILIPIALGLGLLGLAAFFWSLRSGQFDDLDGAAVRILDDDDESATRPAIPTPQESFEPAKSSFGATIRE